MPKKKSKIFFTLPHNNPSGGIKVVNEFVNLCNEKGYESYLCLPENELNPASFLNTPAPIMSLDKMISISTQNDFIISCWQSKIEFNAVKLSQAKMKVFWQHGLLISNTKHDVGDEVYISNIFNKYANVSHACGEYIQNKYNKEIYIINPFFDFVNEDYSESHKREGFILLARRGSEYIPLIKKYLKEKKQSLTILHEPFSNQHFLNLLKLHKFFISIDNGLKYTLTFKEKVKGKKINWVKHSKNYLGFPVPPLEAAQSKTSIIGFAMGGGLEWMSNNNTFLAIDDSIEDLLSNIDKAINTDHQKLEDKINLAFDDTLKFTKENSWNQLKQVLEL